jgi:crotonobetainyl-CoA:carnitine CoA-transferase CaiB-like acyl-CoA transferase
MDRLGVGAEAATQKNPALVYCSMPGFAHDDPRANLQAWEGIIDAATDNCSPRVGEETPGWDWSRPFYSAVTLASNFGGFLGATGVVMALIARERMGQGQTVEAPLFDSMFTLIGHSGAYRHDKGLHPPRVFTAGGPGRSGARTASTSSSIPRARDTGCGSPEKPGSRRRGSQSCSISTRSRTKR